MRVFCNTWASLALAGVLLAWVGVARATDDHLLLTEAVVTPTEAEFIEIANPTASPVALENYWLTDAQDYYLVTQAAAGGSGPAVVSSDFTAQFPAGATIGSMQVIVVAFDAAGFLATHGFSPDYEIHDTDPAVPNMEGPYIGSSAGLTNGGENACLFFWDGVSDLVQDVDMLNIGTPSSGNKIAVKTGVMIDGPDAGTDPSTYATDSDTMPLQAGDAGAGFSTKRIAPEGAAELTGGGNGLTGDDETSEDISLTWDSAFSAPSPGVYEAFGGSVSIPIEPGIDLYQTVMASVDFGGGALAPLPADFFGPGSDPFVGVIQLVGSPLVFAGGQDLSPTDTILERTTTGSLDDAPSQTTVDVEIVALSLVSTTPITVTSFGGSSTEEWDVQVVLSSIGQDTGTMTINRDCVDGGTFSASVPVTSRLIFTNGASTQILDFGAIGAGANLSVTTEGVWSLGAYDPSLSIVGPAPVGLELDADLDGTPETLLPGPTANFNAGVTLSPCDPTTLPGESSQSLATICYAGTGTVTCVQAPVPPAPPCLEPSDLTFVSDCDTGTATLSWSNGETYDSIEITRDGSVIAVLGGDEESYVDNTVTAGIHDYTVTGYCGGSAVNVSGLLNQCPTLSINEIRIDQPGTDDDEYAELVGMPGQSLDGIFYITIGDGSGGGGVLESVSSLDGVIVDADTFVLLANDGDTLGVPADLITMLLFENSDNVTHLLVTGLHAELGDDLDFDDDGVLDVTPWAAVIDSVALLEELGAGDPVYSTTTVGPDGSFVPGHVVRCAGEWGSGLFDPADSFDTPGAENICNDCEPDGIADIVAIAQGLVSDCNFNAVPDNCEIAADPTIDCNDNGVLDSCDIAAGTSIDLDEDGVPDECAVVGPTFVRGDCNADGASDIADAIYMLAALFSGGPAGPCADSCDGNDDGANDIADAIYLLAALFSGGPQPPAPTSECGVDPTDDALGCDAFVPCD